MKIMIAGASGGIGRVLTKNFDFKENTLYLTYNTSKDNIYPVENAKFILTKCDFTQEEEVIKNFSEIQPLDVLINVMGHVENNLIVRMREKEWDRVIASNLKTVFLSCKHGVTNVIENGHIINFSSVLGEMGMIGATNYVASKGAVEAFTRSFALECLHKRKIYVNAIALGYFKVGLGLKLEKKIIDLIKEKIPLKEFGEPEEIQQLVNYLISSKYTIGQIFRLNGGLRI